MGRSCDLSRVYVSQVHTMGRSCDLSRVCVCVCM